MNIEDQARARFREGLALHQKGQAGPAMALYEEALRISPVQVDALYLSGVLAAQTGNRERALEFFGRAIAVAPAHADARSDRGAVLCDLAQFGPAIEDFDKAIALNAAHADAWYGRGRALHALGRFGDAIQSYNAALRIDPRFAEAHNNRGTALRELKRFQDALESFDAAIALQPGYAMAHYNRGGVLRDIGERQAALQSYDRAIALNGSYAQAHNNRGLLLRELNRVDEAIESYGRALAADPGLAEAYNNRGNALLGNKQHPAAIGDYDRALALRPDIPYAFGMRLHAQMILCDWRDFGGQSAQLAAKIHRGEKAAPAFVALALSDSPALQLRCAEIWAQDRQPAGAAPGSLKRHGRHARIRLAFVSADFREHPGAYNMAGLFENLDRSRFETHAISIGPDAPGEMRDRLKKAFDHFIDAGGRSEFEIAAMMRALEIDIAVDIMGPTEGERGAIFALRAAPIQVNHFAFASGASCYDYIVADPVCLPADHQGHVSEKAVRLPHTLFATDRNRPIAAQTPSRAEAGLPKQGFVFCSFNNSYKITPPDFDIWMRLLQKVPGSVLWLRETNAAMPDNLRREAGARGIDPDRLVFAGVAPRMEDHLARHRLADLFLDTLTFNAQTTASDALWAGLPLLTCPGQTMVSRVAASLLAAMDMPELIAPTRESYEERALHLATHPGELSAIRQKLADHRLTTPLFDTQLYARHMEEAFVQMVERYLAGLPAADIRVGSV